MKLEEILTNRNRLSEDILGAVKETAAGYGVAVLRADVKDLIFPGNVQDVMNRLLTADRMSQAQLIDARTKAKIFQIDAQARVNARRAEAEAEAEATRIRTAAEIAALREHEQYAEAYTRFPTLLRLRELEALAALNSNTQVYISFDGTEIP
jgi:regulator of protease activity HflC (stomatin/prohibitin superfamily)